MFSLAGLSLLFSCGQFNISPEDLSDKKKIPDTQSPSEELRFSSSEVTTALETCTLCHGANLQQAGKNFTDYGSISTVVDPSNPASSDILLYGTNTAEETHGGGAIWTVGDENYTTILAWIEAGAME